jgi:hypothetical protein
MHECEHCKATIREQAKFCPQCGYPVAEGDIPQYAWQIDVPLINNRFILLNTGTGIGIALTIFFILLGSIFGYHNGWEGIGQAAIATLGIGFFFLLVSLLTLTVVLGNRYQMEFAVGKDCMMMVSRSSRAHTVHRMAFLVGLLARNMAATGAGLSALATETITLEWKNARTVILHPDKYTLTVKRKFMPALHVFCTPENFTQVSQYIVERIKESLNSGKENQQ